MRQSVLHKQSKNEIGQKSVHALLQEKLAERRCIFENYKQSISDFYTGYESSAKISFDKITRYAIKHGDQKLSLKDLPQLEPTINFWHLKAAKVFCMMMDIYKHDSKPINCILTKLPGYTKDHNEAIPELLSAGAVYASMQGVFLDTLNPSKAFKDYEAMVKFKPNYDDPLFKYYGPDQLNLLSLNSANLLLENPVKPYRHQTAKTLSSSISFLSNRTILMPVYEALMDHSDNPTLIRFQRNLTTIHQDFYMNLESRPETTPNRILLLP